MTLSTDEFLRRFLQHVLPAVLYAFARSDSSPIVGVRPYYLYANAYWSYPRNQPLQRVQRLRQPPSGGVLDAAVRWS